MQAGRRAAGLLAALLVSMTTPTFAQDTGVRTLDVPYVPQTALLCGGAAAAMVERYWGRHAVYAEDYASLVRPALGGITTVDLSAAVRERGWRVEGLDATPAAVQRSLAAGAPVIVLLAEGEDRYHYVVIVGWTQGRVIYHDPTRGPRRTIPEPAFLSAWTAADRWNMRLLPGEAAPPAEATAAAAPLRRSGAGAARCAADVAYALDAAEADRLDDADRWLVAARQRCPEDPAVVRELAGVRFRQGRTREAAALGEAYVRVRPADPYGWRLVATSRFLAGDRPGALDAWRRAGRSAVDLVRIDGLSRTHHTAAQHAVGLASGDTLSPRALALMRRRLADIPAFAGATVDYRPVPGDRIEVRAAVRERPSTLAISPRMIGTAVGAVAEHEVTVHFPSLLHGGGLVTARGRWQRARPLASLGVAMPASIGIPGVFDLTAAWTRMRVALASGTDSVTEARRAATATYGAWLTPAFRAAIGVGYERWTSGARHLPVSLAGALWLARDRLVIRLAGIHAFEIGGGRDYRFAALAADWRSATDRTGTVWSLRAGVSAANAGTPLSRRPITGSDVGEVIVLRAHPVTSGAAVAGTNIGRIVTHGGAGLERGVARLGPAVLAVGGFVDAAQIGGPVVRDGAAAFRVDAGIGLRFHVGRQTLRVDLAQGLADPARALSVGLHTGWPLRHP